MPTDDFLRPITLDPLGTEIPTADVAVGIEHVNRIIRDALNEPAELFLALADRLFSCSAFGQVARDLGIADELAGGTTDRIDDHMRPEAASILALAPAFSLEPAVLLSRGERTRRHSCGAVLWQIETGKMLAENFGRRVTLEALRASIPACDDAFGAQHIDSIVGDGIDQEAKASLFVKRRVMSIQHFHMRPLTTSAL